MSLAGLNAAVELTSAPPVPCVDLLRFERGDLFHEDVEPSSAWQFSNVRV